jgi:hypothetical protein
VAPKAGILLAAVAKSLVFFAVGKRRGGHVIGTSPGHAGPSRSVVALTVMVYGLETGRKRVTRCIPLPRGAGSPPRVHGCDMRLVQAYLEHIARGPPDTTGLVLWTRSPPVRPTLPMGPA